MIAITFIQPDGEAKTVGATTGLSLMEVARDNGIEGVVADCGGECACATCHVQIAAEWRDRIGARSEDETDLLEFAKGTSVDSRLSCQIAISDQLDGMVIRIPEEQY